MGFPYCSKLKRKGCLKLSSCWATQVTLLILSVVSNSSKYDMIVNIFLVVLLVSMVLWRLYLLWLSYSAYGGNLPYSCGHATVGGKELSWIIAT